MRLEYDLAVGALYISLTDGSVARTVQIDDNTAVDVDAAGSVVGIEVCSVGHGWPLSAILREYDIPAEDTAQLLAYFVLPVGGTTTLASSVAQAPPEVTIQPVAPVLIDAAA
jgi:uncharacterized protein YuzE